MYSVYVYLDPRKPGKWQTDQVTFLFEPIYVGEGLTYRYGKRNKGRAYDHLRNVNNPNDNSMKTNKIRKILECGLEPFILILHDGLQGDESIVMESNLIKQIGTRAKIDGVIDGPLTNMLINEKTKTIFSAETRKKISERVSAALIGHKHSAETREKISASYNYGEVAKANRSKAQRGRTQTDETKNKISDSLKGVTKSDDHKDKISEALKGKGKSQSHRERISASKKCTWKLMHEQTGKIEFTKNLGHWCLVNSINHEALKSAFRKHKAHKGYMLLKVE